MKYVAVAFIACLAIFSALRFLSVDSCLDSGGMWAGPMGCQTRLPAVDRLLIDKSDRTLTAFAGGKSVATMKVALGRQPIGNKQHEGDNRTPEGIYPVSFHKSDSAFYRALRLGYPTAAQSAAARLKGIDPGGDIMIHGLPNGLGWIGSAHRLVDWTRGCIAVTDGEISWLFQTVPNGTPVEIRA